MCGKECEELYSDRENETVYWLTSKTVTSGIVVIVLPLKRFYQPTDNKLGSMSDCGRGRCAGLRR